MVERAVPGRELSPVKPDSEPLLGVVLSHLDECLSV